MSDVAPTSRYDQWGYVGRPEPLENAPAILAGLVDMRVALSLSLEDCDVIAAVLAEAMAASAGAAHEEMLAAAS